MKPARLLPPAVEDLEAAVRLVDHARPGWGDKLEMEVLDALEYIERHPVGWQRIDDGQERRFVLDRFPCVLVYREAATEIVVTAIVYGGREPGYWRGRL